MYVDHISSVLPDERMVVIRDSGQYPQIRNSASFQVSGFKLVKLWDDELIGKVKFEFIKYLKTLPDPEDRVADFECRREDGSFCFQTEERLVESRKTIQEKQKEINEDNELRELCHKFKIPYEGIIKGGL